LVRNSERFLQKLVVILPCNTLDHTATQELHCNTLDHTATQEPNCNTLHHTATQKPHCNTLHHTTTQKPHCNTLDHTATQKRRDLALGGELGKILREVGSNNPDETVVGEARQHLAIGAHTHAPQRPCSQLLILCVCS